MALTTEPNTLAPERTPEQRLEALTRANEVRTKRAKFKRDLKGGRKSIRQALVNPPDYLKTAKVVVILMALPKYGQVKANKVMVQCRISPTKTVAGLSKRQRKELLSFFGHRG